jgi:hypothetical protein
MYTELLLMVVLAAIFIVAAVPLRDRIGIRKSVRRIEAELIEMEKKINILQLQESRRMMAELKENPAVEIEPPAVWRHPGGGIWPGDVAPLPFVAKDRRRLPPPDDEDAVLAPAHCDSARR